MKLSARSIRNLLGVHPALVRVVESAAAVTPLDFEVIEGVRTIERQRELVAKGASTTMNSRHLTGHAVDVVPVLDGSIRWDWPLYFRLADVIKQAARTEGVAVQWGGDWRRFRDGPHWEIDPARYPMERQT